MKKVLFGLLIFLSACATSFQREQKIGVMLGSFDPFHDSHKRIAEQAKLLYKLDTMIIVPAGDNPVHGKSYKFPGRVRIKIVHDRVKNMPGVIVYDGEVNGETRYTIDTLNALKKKGIIPKASQVYIVEGQDTLETVPTWKNANQLLSEYSWIVATRGSENALKINAPSGYIKASPQRYENPQTGRFIHLINMHTGDTSSGAIRARMKNVDTVYYSEQPKAVRENVKVIATQTSSWPRFLNIPRDGTLDLEAHMDEILDPEVRLIMLQGQDCTVHPQLESIVKAINPKRVIMDATDVDTCHVRALFKQWGFKVTSQTAF